MAYNFKEETLNRCRCHLALLWHTFGVAISLLHNIWQTAPVEGGYDPLEVGKSGGVVGLPSFFSGRALSGRYKGTLCASDSRIVVMHAYLQSSSQPFFGRSHHHFPCRCRRYGNAIAIAIASKWG